MSETPSGNAIISVYDKTGIAEFAAALVDQGWRVYASGGTARKIDEAGVDVTDVAELVGGEAILGHRVVTLSREVYAGLLADTSKPQDMEELKRLAIPLIGLACVDMYPLEAEIGKPGATIRGVIEQTDIGGPTILRAAAKGRRIVLSVAEQRQQVLDWLTAGKPDEAEFLEALAARAEYEAARYILPLALYLNGTGMTGAIARLESKTKYGENPQQVPAGFYADNRVNIDPLGLDRFIHVQGMERSYVNMTDMDRLLQTTTHIAAGFQRNFGSVPPMAVGVKHGNACCAAVANTMVEAVKRALESDTRAIFGGVVMINGEIDEDVAKTLMNYAMQEGSTRLLDGVAGSSVTDEALELLSRKKLRVVVNPALATLSETSLDTRRRSRPVRGGFLEQPNYTFILDLGAKHIQQYGEVTEQQKRDLVLAWSVGTTSNSNTITLVKDGQLIGNGVGQQDRVGAGQLALTRTTIELPTIEDQADNLVVRTTLDRSKLKDSVAYSDSFFPFPDGPGLLAEAGVKAILTSSGSIADTTIVAALRARGVSVIMVPDKIGRGFYAH